MVDDINENAKYTAWHRFLGQGLRLSIGQTQVLVETELEITSSPPRIEIVLLRRKTETWTDAQRTMLPDGIRNTNASDILLEFKYTESLTQDAILQAPAYEYFYRKGHALTPENVQIFILCSMTPHASRLAKFEYNQTDLPGVYRSQNRYISHIMLLVLNQLRAEPHNALVKAFSSREIEKGKAFSLLYRFWRLSAEMLTMQKGLEALWSLPQGANMQEELTLERVMEIGEYSKWALLENLPPEELYTYIDPDYRKKIEQQGIEQGIEQGVQKTILQILQTRFDTVSDEITAVLSGCSLEQLQALVNAALDVPNLNAFLSQIPKTDEESTKPNAADNTDTA